ncbi:MAG: DUF3168 domain-containing protein [Sphingomonas sp.]|nr:DUF3168 domain-containing protein [Sphingomonas sp.]
MSAGEALAKAATAKLAGIAGLSGIFDARPWQAAHPYATVDAGAEADWSHKTGAGREVRLAIAIRDKGERPERLRRLIAAAEAAMAGPDMATGGWRIVSLAFLRMRIVPDGRDGWIGTIDYRARMLAIEG